MSRHEGVSCDSCLKGNFRGRRYKCLVCYDYDLCAACYEAGSTNTRHTTDHPMQCILTRSDFELYYGGEALTSLELPQSYTCPYCSRMGFTDVTLQEHVTSDHQDTNLEVICPLCAAMPGGDPNLMTDDFAGHLTLEHRTGPRDLISFLDEPAGTRHSVRRIPHNSNHATNHLSRGGTPFRPRRSNMHFSVFSSGGLPSLSPSSREVDPIAELLSQLSGVRRSASNTNSSTPTQLQQLQMQLQLERQQVNAARQQLERFPRRQTSNHTLREPSISNCGTSTMMLNASPVMVQPSASAPAQPSYTSQFLLTGLLEELGHPGSNETSLTLGHFMDELIWEGQEYVLRLVPLDDGYYAFEVEATFSDEDISLPGPSTSTCPRIVRRWSKRRLFLLRGLLEELAQQSSNDTVRMERSRFVEELVTATAVQVPSAENLLQLIPVSCLELEDKAGEPEKSHPEEDASTLAPSASNAPKAVLRGRARCDPQNAKRRAEANKSNGTDETDR